MEDLGFIYPALLSLLWDCCVHSNKILFTLDTSSMFLMRRVRRQWCNYASIMESGPSRQSGPLRENMFLYNISGTTSKNGKSTFAGLRKLNKGWQQSQFIQGQRPNCSKNSDAPGALTCPGAFSLTPSLWGPENQQPQDDRRPEEQQPRRVWMGKNGVKAPKASPLGKWHPPACLKLLETLTAKAVPYWTSLRSRRLWAIFFHTYFENNQWRLFNITAAWGRSTIWTKHKAHQK